MSLLPESAEFIFWEPCTSPHKQGLFECLSTIKGCTVLVVADSGLPTDRIEQGWIHESPTGNVTELISPDSSLIEEIFERYPAAIHVFSGIRWFRVIEEGLRLAIRLGRRYLLMSEPRVLEGLGGMARLIHSLLTERRIRATAAGVLAIGAHGPRFFKLAGYPEEKIFPFAYFVDPPKRSPMSVGSGVESSHSESKQVPVIGYLGRLEKEKGVHLISDAVSQSSSNLHLLIGGAGAESDSLSKTLSQKSISHQLVGKIPMNQISEFYRKIDILVLPSITTNDGWGVVVSEALHCGVAPVVSSSVGASVLINHNPALGGVFNSGDVASFASALKAQIKSLDRPDELEWRAKWAQAHISSLAGANYFLALVSHIFDHAPLPGPFYSCAYA